MTEMKVTIRDNGPLLVEGPAVLVDVEGNAIAIPEGKASIALCRCGQSNNKPFCDGSHRACGFQSVIRAAPKS